MGSGVGAVQERDSVDPPVRNEPRLAAIRVCNQTHTP